MVISLVHVSAAQVPNDNFCIHQYMAHIYYGIYRADI